jgi:hypothetical protein
MGNDISSPNRLKFKVIIDKNEAISLLNKAEKEDMYLEECYDDKANSVARYNCSYAPNLIPLREINYANNYFSIASSMIPQRLLSELSEVKIINLMPTADGGMPHTRPGNIICYPIFDQIYSDSTLVHELWHIHQREFKNIWFKVFKRLGWLLWDGKLPEMLESNRRINPDTIDCPLWIFNGEWIPVPIFKDVSHPKINDVEIWYYNPNNRYHTKKTPIELESYFPDLPPSAYEHPREITAYLLSEPHKYENTLGFKHLIEEVGNISVVQKTKE